ncbi:hypothetical protein METBIDRAFT_147235 [Metschnikowia bicuspidata var. bicuspidata NRRL YB-4993]|uniref:Uncharacterized protein n=1 Tax=Metschnikowia bicuspidata var. bicuspidata NRRL YB-4993 TaxID=869754 RepID=A0A1A0HDT4_9ASCO|nr:hypothetical protein METBIDRAFT_147235 [Metschnikowia bicuspidata var. bicuspidata NRRL YB-4993]OBA22140.1 hypothetical protein METBIDRAFT_147235 [Metschnikowia bicuspidata var. bicuspidata NRRL YB-4993]
MSFNANDNSNINDHSHQYHHHGHQDHHDHRNHHDHHEHHDHDHKSTLKKVGDKIKGVLGKDSSDDDGSVGKTQNTTVPGESRRPSAGNPVSIPSESNEIHSPSGRAEGISPSSKDNHSLSENTQDSYGSHMPPQESFGVAGGDFWSSGNQYKLTKTEYEPAAGMDDPFQNSGDAYGSSERTSTGVPGEGGDIYGARRAQESLGSFDDAFGSPGGGKHDYEGPSKGFGTTGGGGDSYGSGYVEYT